MGSGTRSDRQIGTARRATLACVHRYGSVAMRIYSKMDEADSHQKETSSSSRMGSLAEIDDNCSCALAL